MQDLCSDLTAAARYAGSFPAAAGGEGCGLKAPDGVAA